MKQFDYFRLSRSFWRRFNSTHRDLTMKRQGQVSMNRALNCTKEMACSHLGKCYMLYILNSNY